MVGVNQLLSLTISLAVIRFLASIILSGRKPLLTKKFKVIRSPKIMIWFLREDILILCILFIKMILFAEIYRGYVNI